MTYMKSKIITFIILIIIGLTSATDATAQKRHTRKATTTTQQKEGSITGVVRYKYNDYQGYKSDLGAMVIAVPTSAIDSIISFDKIKLYEELAEKKTKHQMIRKELMSEGMNGDLAHTIVSFGESSEKQLEEIDSLIIDAFISAKMNKSNIAVVDASGTYTMSLPFGEYYIVFKSKNRERATISELSGRIHFEKLKLSTPAEIIGYDFDY